MSHDLDTRTHDLDARAADTARAIIDRTEQRVADLVSAQQLTLPRGYAWQNALRGAWLHLQEARYTRGPQKGKLYLQVCSQASIANALLDMIVQGLAVHRRQGYFIPYDGRLTFTRSYFGTITVARRVAGLIDAVAQPVYAGDTLQLHIERGLLRVADHQTTLESMVAGDMTAVYAVLTFADSSRDRCELMTMADVRASWSQSRQAQYGDSPHQQFGVEMAKRTVINRALKLLVNSTADDDPMLLDAWNRDADDDADMAAVTEANTRDLPVDVDDDPDDNGPADDDADIIDVQADDPAPDPDDGDGRDADIIDGRLFGDDPGF